MKRLLCLTSVALFVFSAALVTADPPVNLRGKFQHMLEKEDSILSTLNLTPGQTEKFRTLRESFKKDIAPLRSRKYEKKAELRLLWMAPHPETDRIRAKQKALHDLIWWLIQKDTAYRLAFRDILTPEQLSKFLDMGGGR